jgi:hypothetical protein
VCAAWQRSLMLRMVAALHRAMVEGPFPHLERPPRYRMYTVPLFNLTHLEILVGATQVGADSWSAAAGFARLGFGRVLPV